MKSVPTIEIDEYGTVSVLRALKIPVIETRFDGQRAYFSFDDSGKQASKAIASHITGELSLPTREMLTAFASVKAEIFELRRGGASR